MSAAPPFVLPVLQRLGSVRPMAGGWSAQCPAHEDRHASLKLDARDGRLLLHCHAGCAPEAIVGALGLAMADLFEKAPEARQDRPARSQRRPQARTTRYDVRDAAGALVAIHERQDGPAGKRYAWRQPDGTPNLAGKPTAELPLYGIERLASWPTDAPIIVAEGEKAADALIAAGMPALGTVTGAAATPGPAVLAPLAGRIVALWPDADGPGRAHMERIAGMLDVLASVLVVTWPEAPEHGDAANFLSGRTAEDVRALLAQAVAWTPGAIHSFAPDAPSERMNALRFLSGPELAAETSAEVPWIVSPYIASGAIAELDGRPKAAGKTTFLAYLVRSVLDGVPFLGEPTVRTSVVLLSEQPPTSLRATLGRAGLLEREDLRLLLWRDAHATPWPEIVAAAVAECERIGARLLVVDTLPAFAALGGDSENDAGAALTALRPLQAAAADGLAVLIARHDRKGGGEVGDSGRGSSAFTGAVDVVLALRRGDGDSRPTIRHLAALSRFDATPPEVVVELTPNGYVNLGTSEAVALAEARTAVLDALADGAAMTRDELTAAVELKRTSVWAALAELVDAGEVGRDGAGRKGDPFRFRHRGSGAFVRTPPPTGEGGSSERMNEPNPARVVSLFGKPEGGA